MSVFIAKQQKTADFLPEIRTEGDIMAERETLRNSVANKENLDLIFSIYGKSHSFKQYLMAFRYNEMYS